MIRYTYELRKTIIVDIDAENKAMAEIALHEADVREEYAQSWTKANPVLDMVYAETITTPTPNPLHELFSRTDWKLLRKQKAYLTGAAKGVGFGQEHLTGVLYFLDAIQDAAVASGQLSEQQVFGKKGKHNV